MSFRHEKLDVYRLAIEYVGWVLKEAENLERKKELDRMAAMLTRLGGGGYRVTEEEVIYETERDTDSGRVIT